jgi:hypothetical protein
MDGRVEWSIDPCAVLDLRIMEDRVIVSSPASPVHGAVDLVLDSMFKHAQGEVDCQVILDLLSPRGVELHVDYVLECLQKIEEGGVPSLSDSMSDRGHVPVVPQNTDDSVNSFSHVVGEEKAFIDLFEGLTPSSVDASWYDYCGRIEGARGNYRGEAEFWCYEGSRGFRRRGNGGGRWGSRSPSRGGGGSRGDRERSGRLVLISGGGGPDRGIVFWGGEAGGYSFGFPPVFTPVGSSLVVDRDVVGGDGEGGDDWESDGDRNRENWGRGAGVRKYVAGDGWGRHLFV